MDTEKIVVLKNTENVTTHDLSEEFITIVCDYVEINRHVQEINQLFDVFQFNIERLMVTYEICSDDCFNRKTEFETDYTDFVAINAFMMNIISAGRSLVDALDICMVNAYGEKSDKYNDYKLCRSAVYDGKFAYRFFYHLRNFAQHNHLLISTEDNFCYFDAAQILDTPHYKANKKMWDELESICSEIRERYKDNFRISLSLCLIEYIAGVAERYKVFWEYIKDRLFELKGEIDKALEQEPEILEHGNEKFNGYILYQTPGKPDWHAFAPYNDMDTYYENCMESAMDFFVESDTEYKTLQKHFEKISSEA